MTLLAAKTLGLGHGDALKPDLVQGFLHFIQLEGFDDRFDLLHHGAATSSFQSVKHMPCQFGKKHIVL
jgi:hypothetical protein